MNSKGIRGLLAAALGFGLAAAGASGPAHAILFDLQATSLAVPGHSLPGVTGVLTDFTIRFDDGVGGDGLLQHSEIQSFSGVTVITSSGLVVSPDTVDTVPVIPGFAVPSGVAGVGTVWNFSGDPVFGGFSASRDIWTYALSPVGAPPPGSSADDPLLPTVITPGGFSFTFTPPDHTVPFFIDPDVATGYDYAVTSGPNFASVLVPEALPNGDSEFTLDLGIHGLFALLAGVEFDLLAVVAEGLSSFSILEIDTDEGLDPTDPLAFVTGLTFVDGGEVTVTQDPIVEHVAATIPEPGTFGLFALGLLGFGVLSRRRRHNGAYWIWR